MNRNLPVSNVVTGMVVAFPYLGGSNPGTLRIVKVKEVDSTHIKGDDSTVTPVDGSTYRDFLKSKVVNSSVHLVAGLNEEVVPLSTMVQPGFKVDHQLAEAIFNHNHPNRKGVRYDNYVEAIVAMRDDVPRIEVQITADKIRFNVVNEHGEELGIWWGHAGIVAGTDPVNCRIDQATLENFANQLLSHINKVKAKSTHTVGGQQDWNEFVDTQVKAGNPFYVGVKNNG